MPDPKLTTAREEIKAILKAHDICGLVMLASPTHTNFVIEPEASWNSLRLQQSPTGEWQGIRLRCLRKDFPTKEAWQESMRQSVSTVMGFLDCAQEIKEQLAHLALMVAEAGVQVEHFSKRDH